MPRRSSAQIAPKSAGAPAPPTRACSPKAASFPRCNASRGDNDGFLRDMTAASSGFPEATRGYDFMFPLFLVGYGVDVGTVRGILDRIPVELEWATNDDVVPPRLDDARHRAAFVGDETRTDAAWRRLLP